MARKPKLRLHASGQYCTSAGCPKGGLKYFGRDRKAAEKAFKAYLESLTRPPESSGRVDDLCNGFLHELSGSDPQTLAQKRWALDQWINWVNDKGIPCGLRQAADITKKDLETFAKSKLVTDSPTTGKPLSPASVNHVLGAVKMAWVWATNKDDPLLSRNPLAGVKSIAEPPREPEYFHRETVAKILRYARRDRSPFVAGHQSSKWKNNSRPEDAKAGRLDRKPSENPFRVWAVLIRFSYHTGLRLSEICRLDWSMVDFHAGQIRYRQHKTVKRTGRVRTVSLDATATRMLAKLKRNGLIAGPVFLNRDGRAFLPQSLTLRFRRMRKTLGLPENFRLTSMRHTVASDLIRAGESTKMVADMLGHTSTRMVEKVYGHLLDSDYREAVERREKFRGRHRKRQGKS